jgi:hypothetical protein
VLGSFLSSLECLGSLYPCPNLHRFPLRLVPHVRLIELLEWLTGEREKLMAFPTGLITTVSGRETHLDTLLPPAGEGVIRPFLPLNTVQTLEKIRKHPGDLIPVSCSCCSGQIRCEPGYLLAVAVTRNDIPRAVALLVAGRQALYGDEIFESMRTPSRAAAESCQLTELF